jgi:hypothetical protein
MGGGGGGSSPQPAPKPADSRVESALVSVRGVNVPCRPNPDGFLADPGRVSQFSAPAQLAVTCWAGPTPGTQAGRDGQDDVWLMTKTGCFIRPGEVEEYRDYRQVLRPCGDVRRHWIGTLAPQYSRKDCYYCTSVQTCGSEDLGSPPYVDLLCQAVGEEAGGNTTWYKNKGKECYFPAGALDPNGFMGTPGGMC